MRSTIDIESAHEVAKSILAECDSLPIQNASTLRAVRKKYSSLLKVVQADFVVQIASELNQMGRYRWIGYEMILANKAAFKCLDAGEVEQLGQGIDSWWTVDSFARTISGPAWLAGLIPDELILKWANSPDHWWRRAALVSTVALNVRSQGGMGDVSRTLKICRLLVGDKQDMVIKAMSWALRELGVHDASAVEAFLDEHDEVLAGRVKREVRNKLKTGLKNPKGVLK
jgi:3-methyladenine DNA glycosylase AlkD